MKKIGDHLYEFKWNPSLGFLLIDKGFLFLIRDLFRDKITQNVSSTFDVADIVIFDTLQIGDKLMVSLDDHPLVHRQLKLVGMKFEEFGDRLFHMVDAKHPDISVDIKVFEELLI